MDFVSGLPESKSGNNSVLVVVDRLSKMRYLVLCSTKNQGTAAPAIAQLYIDHVWKLHGLPRTIVLDRGKQFDSLFWRRLCERLGIKVAMSTAYHPQTDGQTENANAVMEQYLRCYVN